MTIHLPNATFLWSEWTDDAGHQHGAWAAFSEHANFQWHWQSMGMDFASFVRGVDGLYLRAKLGFGCGWFVTECWPLFVEAVQRQESELRQVMGQAVERMEVER